MLMLVPIAICVCVRVCVCLYVYLPVSTWLFPFCSVARHQSMSVSSKALKAYIQACLQNMTPWQFIPTLQHWKLILSRHQPRWTTPPVTSWWVWHKIFIPQKSCHIQATVTKPNIHMMLITINEHIIYCAYDCVRTLYLRTIKWAVWHLFTLNFHDCN